MMSPAQKNWDSAIQMSYKQDSILNSVDICLDRGRGHFKSPGEWSMRNNIFLPVWISFIYDKAHNNGSKSTLTLLLLTSIALVVSGGCAVKQSSIVDAKSNAGATTRVKSTEIKISSTEFNYKPSRIKVKEGQEVILTLDNRQGAIEHDFVIKELGVHLAAKAGQVTSQNLVFKHPGDYEFICTLPGHHEFGMSGKLTVEPSNLTATPISPNNDDMHAGTVKILDLPKGISHLPTPKAAPPLIRRKPELVKVELEAIL